MEVKPEKDAEFEQKFTLLQFVSDNKKYEKGKTIGIKVCGTYNNEKELEEGAAKLYKEGEIYFPIETQNVGEWIPFPDYSQDNREETQYFHENVSSSYGETLDLNSVMREKKKQEEKIKKETEDRKTFLKQSTYMGVPESEDDFNSLLAMNLGMLENEINSYNFFKDALNRDLTAYEEAPEKLIEEYEIKKDKDYTELLQTNTDKKYCLFSFAHENTRQKSDYFTFKIRGTFSCEKEMKDHLDKLDKTFDIYTTETGKWMGFNSDQTVSPEKIEEDLNLMLGKEVEKNIENNKKFKDRVKYYSDNKNEKKTPIEDKIVLTKKDIGKHIEKIKDKIKHHLNEIVDINNILKINMSKKEINNTELQKIYKDVKVLLEPFEDVLN